MGNQIIQVLIGSVVSILVIVIPALSKLIGKYIKVQLSIAEQKMGTEEYKSNVNMAISFVKIIEERFRLGEIAEDKLGEFEKLMLDKIPTLTQQQIDELRDLAVSEVDKQIGKR